VSAKSRLRAKFSSSPLDVGMLDAPQIRGTDSDAIQGPDGTWTIRDVPIFADTERDYRDAGGRPHKYTAQGDWHQKAIARAQARYAETGYMARIIVRHSSPGKDREGAGFVMPRRVGSMTIDGRSKQVLFADYIGVPDRVYQRMKRHELPYRSAETPLDGRPEIKALAFLPGEEPFHPFGPHTIRREVPHPAAIDPLRESRPVFHFNVSGAKARFTVRIPKMPETTAGLTTGTLTTDGNSTASASTTEPVVAHMAPAGSVESKIDEILALLQKIAADESAEDVAETPVAEPGADAKGADPVTQMRAEYEGKIAAFTTTVENLTGELAALKAEKASAAVRAKAVSALKSRNVPGDHDKIVTDALAKFKTDDAMLAFVEGFASNLPLEPGEGPTAMERSVPVPQGDAMNFESEYATFASLGTGFIPRTSGKPMTKEQYVASRKATLGSK
jgi:hypothetical protein